MITVSYAATAVAIALCFGLVCSQTPAIVRRHEHATSNRFGELVSSVVVKDGARPLQVRSDGSFVQLGEGYEEYKGVGFELHTSLGQDNLRIPKQVILTGPFKSFADALAHRGDLTMSIGITPDLSVRYFNDAACRAYLESNDPDLVAFFDAEKHGSYRGDLCRTSVLAREGGFYVDLDMQLRVPLKKLVDDNTTFMTARAAYGGALNALIGTVPDSPVMLSTLKHMRKWYRKEILQDGLLGPRTMQLGLQEAMKTRCPEQNWDSAFQQFKCGPQQAFRLFTEQLIGWGDCQKWMPTMCPLARAQSQLSAAKFGLFDTERDDRFVGGDLTRNDELKHGLIENPVSGQIADREHKFIGWPRFDGCKELGCGMNGGIASLLQQ